MSYHRVIEDRKRAFRRAVRQAQDTAHAITFSPQLHGTTRAERQAEYRATCATAQDLAAQGRIICVAELLAQAGQVYTPDQEAQ